MGLIHPTEGHIRVFGHKVRPGAPVLSRIGSFVEGSGFLPHLSGAANLRLYWAATGRPDATRRTSTEALEIAGLGDAVHRRVRTYSQGMRQRLAIAQAMLGLPGPAGAGRADQRARPAPDPPDARGAAPRTPRRAARCWSPVAPAGRGGADLLRTWSSCTRAGSSPPARSPTSRRAAARRRSASTRPSKAADVLRGVDRRARRARGRGRRARVDWTACRVPRAVGVSSAPGWQSTRPDRDDAWKTRSWSWSVNDFLMAAASATADAQSRDSEALPGRPRRGATQLRADTRRGTPWMQLSASPNRTNSAAEEVDR